MASAAIWSVPVVTALAYAPHFIRQAIVTRFGKADNTRPRDKDAQMAGTPKEMRALAERLAGCHANQMETLALYAGAVACAVAARVPPDQLALLSGYYVRARVAYFCAYTAPPVAGGALRSLTFMGTITTIIMLYGAAANAAADGA